MASIKRAGTWYAAAAAATRGGCGARRIQGHLRLWLCVAAVLAVSPAGAGVMSQAQRGDLQQRYNWMPKSELLAWINGLLQVEYTKIEQCANGAAYCQVLDSLFSDEFPLKRVSFTAKAEHESIKNYKILQQFFMRKGITKTVDVERMIKGRPMDNLEFLQWLRGFFEAHTDVQALQHAVTELEKERDFYYGKLRSVELLCQNAEEDTQVPESVVRICREILGIMYDDAQ